MNVVMIIVLAPNSRPNLNVVITLYTVDSRLSRSENPVPVLTGTSNNR